MVKGIQTIWVEDEEKQYRTQLHQIRTARGRFKRELCNRVSDAFNIKKSK